MDRPLVDRARPGSGRRGSGRRGSSCPGTARRGSARSWIDHDWVGPSWIGRSGSGRSWIGSSWIADHWVGRVVVRPPRDLTTPHEIRPPSDRRDAPLASLRSYVARLGGLAGVAARRGRPARRRARRRQAPRALLLVLLVLTAAAEGLSLNLRLGDSGVTLSLVETAVVADMLLLGPSEAVIAVVGASRLSTCCVGSPPSSSRSTSAQHAVGASVAATLVALAPGRAPSVCGRARRCGWPCSPTGSSAPGRWSVSSPGSSRTRCAISSPQRPLELAATHVGQREPRRDRRRAVGRASPRSCGSSPHPPSPCTCPIRRQLPDRGAARRGPRRA